jgi:CRISPR-associated protein Csy2
MSKSLTRALILLPNLSVTNANLISSPLTWGFPAPSAFTGFGYALQLAMQKLSPSLQVNGVAIACHEVDPQISDGYVKTLKLTRNPVNQDGSTSSFVEEGRCHMRVSLLLDIRAALPLTQDELNQHALPAQLLAQTGAMRLAGGSIQLSQRNAKAWLVDGHPDPQALQREIAKRLLPGRVLVARNELLASHLTALQQVNPEANALDAWLDLQAIHYQAESVAEVQTDDSMPLLAAQAISKTRKTSKPLGDSSKAPKATWTGSRREPGWLVPVPMGYSAIAPLAAAGTVKNARDPSLPFCFVESLIGLGEWLSPFRISQLEHLFWRHAAQPELGLYLVQNSYQPQ